MIVTKRRANLGKFFSEVIVVASEIVGPDSENWDVEFGDGARGKDRIVGQRSPNEGLARHTADRLGKQCAAKGWRVMDAEVRNYRWVANEFEDREFGVVMDAEEELLTQRWGSWDDTAQAFTWGAREKAQS